MPTISMFYGLVVRMFFFDADRHKLPHVHVEYQNHLAVYAIETGRVLAGKLPAKKHKLMIAWLAIHEEELMADWRLAMAGHTLFRIRGLDQ